MKKICISIILGLVILTIVGCSVTQEEDVIGIRGEVTDIDASGSSITLMVEGKIEKDTMYDKARVAVKPETTVVRRQDGADAEADPEDIGLFDKVEVIFEGAVAESYPVQGAAKLIRILG